MKKIEVEISGKKENILKSKICVLKDESKMYARKPLAVEAEKEKVKFVSLLEEAGYLVIQNFDGRS